MSEQQDGWVVEHADDEGSGCPWQVMFRHKGMYLALSYWFPSERKAEKWIDKHLLRTRRVPRGVQ